MTTTKSTTLGRIRYWTGFVNLFADGTTTDPGIYAVTWPDDDRLVHPHALATREPTNPRAESELVDYTRPGYPLDMRGRHLRIAYAGPDPQAVLDALANRVDHERARRQP